MGLFPGGSCSKMLFLYFCKYSSYNLGGGGGLKEGEFFHL